MSEPAWVPIGATGVAPLVTALPSSPLDGQEIILVDSLTAPTYSWHLRYVAAKASNKWVFVGGNPGSSDVDAGEATTSSAYVNLGTVGPSFMLPVAGDYIIEIGYTVMAAAAAGYAYMSFDCGAVAALDGDAALTYVPTAQTMSSVARSRRKLGISGAVVCKYHTGGTSITFGSRWLRVTPIAVGG